jgi:hypothetical protein
MPKRSPFGRGRGGDLAVRRAAPTRSIGTRSPQQVLPFRPLLTRTFARVRDLTTHRRSCTGRDCVAKGIHSMTATIKGSYIVN